MTVENIFNSAINRCIISLLKNKCFKVKKGFALFHLTSQELLRRMLVSEN